MKFILILVICNATCADHHLNGHRRFDNFYDCARVGYKAAELRLVELGQAYVNKNRTAILFKCQVKRQT